MAQFSKQLFSRRFHLNPHGGGGWRMNHSQRLAGFKSDTNTCTHIDIYYYRLGPIHQPPQENATIPAYYRYHLVFQSKAKRQQSKESKIYITCIIWMNPCIHGLQEKKKNGIEWRGMACIKNAQDASPAAICNATLQKKKKKKKKRNNSCMFSVT